MRQAAHAYLETQITTTSQGQILLMLYDGCITYLHQAKEYIAAKNYAQKGILISKALDIIAELSASLNAEKGGELAANLIRLYFYCNKRLFTANLKMDTAPIDEVIKILEGLRNAFAEITHNPEAAAAAQAAAGKRSNSPDRHQAAPIMPAMPHMGTNALKAQGAYTRHILQTEPVADAPEHTAPAAPSPGEAPPPAFFSPAKRMAASTLYQKFAG